MAHVALKSVGKSYGSAEVIGNVDLELDDGSLTVFVGPSGCGKSTLLRMIAGLEPITRGDVMIDGHKVNDATPTERGIAMVFQNYALYPHMSVRENIGFPLRMAGMTKSEIGSRVSAAAGSLKIEHLLDRKPAALSGGQRQRVAIGRAIVREPKVFLFDEPLSNLDGELRVQMRLEIGKLHKQLSSTMIYVTHDQVEAMTLADRIVVMRAGKIEQIGAPNELYANPGNMFVAGFIGSPRMNFLVGRVAIAEDGEVGIRLVDFTNLTIKTTLDHDGVVAGQEVTVGIRPEQFGPDGDASILLTTEEVEYLGGTSYAYGRGISDALVTIELRHGLSSAPGRPLHARFDTSKALVFDRLTGLRLK